jgi:hypothetical protein
MQLNFSAAARHVRLQAIEVQAAAIVADFERRASHPLSKTIDARLLVCLAAAEGHELYLKDLKRELWRPRIFPQVPGYATLTNAAIARLQKNGLVIESKAQRSSGSHRISPRRIRLSSHGLTRLGLK